MAEPLFHLGRNAHGATTVCKPPILATRNGVTRHAGQHAPPIAAAKPAQYHLSRKSLDSTHALPADTRAMTLPDPPPDVAAAIQAADAPDRLLHLRALIYQTAEATGATPLTETLKWGQPAYLPPKRMGTTIRLGTQGGTPALFVHCQTDLVGRWRTLFPTEFAYDGNRAVLIPDDAPEPALAHIIAMALTYHRDKRR